MTGRTAIIVLLLLFLLAAADDDDDVVVPAVGAPPAPVVMLDVVDPDEDIDEVHYDPLADLESGLEATTEEDAQACAVAFLHPWRIPRAAIRFVLVRVAYWPRSWAELTSMMFTFACVTLAWSTVNVQLKVAAAWILSGNRLRACRRYSRRGSGKLLTYYVVFELMLFAAASIYRSTISSLKDLYIFQE